MTAQKRPLVRVSVAAVISFSCRRQILTHCGLARRAAVDETQDSVSSRAEAGVEPEWPGQRVSGVEIDRDPLVAMGICPGERGVDKRVPDALAARAGQGGGGADVGLAVGAQPRYR